MPCSPTRELARENLRTKTPVAPVGLLFSVKCAKPRWSFNTPEIVPGGFPVPRGAGSAGRSLHRLPRCRPHGAPLRPSQDGGPRSVRAGIGSPDAAWPLKLRLEKAWR